MSDTSVAALIGYFAGFASGVGVLGIIQFWWRPRRREFVATGPATHTWEVR